MAVIKQLKSFLAKTPLYPKTLTKAVYDEEGNRLDDILKSTFITTDSEEYTGVEARDADTLGGEEPSYYAKQSDLTSVETSLNSLKGSDFVKVITAGTGSFNLGASATYNWTWDFSSQIPSGFVVNSLGLFTTVTNGDKVSVNGTIGTTSATIYGRNLTSSAVAVNFRISVLLIKQ